MRRPQVHVTDSATEFVARAGRFLEARPIEHNVCVTVLAALRDGDGDRGGGVLAWSEHGGEVTAAVLRTPSRRLLASTLTRRDADALMPELLQVDPRLRSVIGPHPAAGYLAQAWQRATGSEIELGMSMAIYWLRHVTGTVHPTGGTLRAATVTDRDLLVGWTAAFATEAGVDTGEPELAVDRGLRGGGLFVWDDHRPVCLVCTSPPVAGVVRLGPVYTPPEVRRHGYASAAVGAVCRRALANNARTCMLYADLKNSTSNAIYQAVGFRRALDAQEYLLHD